MTAEMTQVPVRALGRMHDRIAALEEALREILGVEVTAPEGGHEEVAQIHRIARDALGVRVREDTLRQNFGSSGGSSC